MGLGDHLEELRTRLILALAGLVIGLVVCLCFGKTIIHIIKLPYIKIMGENAVLTTFAPADVIISYIKICLTSGLLVSSPWVFYQIWMFISAGLYKNEKKYVYWAVPFSTILFITGSLFFLFVVSPLCLQFFIKFNKALELTQLWTLKDYVAFISHLMLVFGIAFQTPTAIFFLNRTGIVSLKFLSSSRKYVILIIVIVAAMATPPDVISQITLAVPLYLLFELGIILSRIFNRNNKD